MIHRRAVRGIGLLAALVFALLTSGMPRAFAHQHPTPAELAGPALVYIESGYHVEIALIEHSVTKAHINVIQRSYDPVLVRGSGFAVDPSAVIVTSGAVVAPDRQSAVNYAVNTIFRETYPGLQLPSDSYTQAQLGQVPDDYSPENRLRACYQNQTNASAGGCVIKLTRVVTVYPYVTDQKKDGTLAATVLSPSEGTNAEIALLRVPAGSMPTVDLVDANSTTYDLGILGFDGIPGKTHELMAYKAHLNKKGGNSFKPVGADNPDFAKVTPKVLGDGLQGGAVAAELGKVIGLAVAPSAALRQNPSGPPLLITSSAVRAALSAQNLKASRGPGDASWESAIHQFQNKGYAAAIPGFRIALSVYPGNFLAAQDLAFAQAHAGDSPGPSAMSMPPSAGGSHTKGVAWWVWVVIVVVIVLAAAAAALLIRRRGGSRELAPAGAPRPRPAAKPAGGAGSPRSPSGAPRPATAAGARDAAATERERSSRVGPASSVALRTDAGPRHDASVVRRQDDASLSPRGDGSSPARNDASIAPRQPAGSANALSFCTSCGGRLAPNHRFCGWCGEPVG